MDPPSLIPAITAVLPTEVDGFPVEVVAIRIGVFLLSGAPRNECLCISYDRDQLVAAPTRCRR